MTVGAFIRSVAGPYERSICAIYRSFFINIPRCIDQISGYIPENAHVIDVGGGDGEVINHLLRKRPDIHVTMLDLRESIGLFLDPAEIARVDLHPATSLSDYLSHSGAPADTLLVCDVVHHIPEPDRLKFIQECRALVKPGGSLIIKDIEPRGIISFLSVMADRYITGDRHVTLIHSKDLIDLVRLRINFKSVEEIISEREHPNYALQFNFD